MGMWDNWNETPDEPERVEQTPVEPEPVEETPVEQTPVEQAAPAREAKPKTPAKRRPGEKVSRQLVARVRDALARLDDADVRHAVAAVSGRDETDVDALAVAVLDGTMGEPAALLVALHDEADDGERARAAVRAYNDRKSQAFKRAVRMMQALDPTGAEAIVGRDLDQAFDLAKAARTMDVEPLRSLVR